MPLRARVARRGAQLPAVGKLAARAPVPAAEPLEDAPLRGFSAPSQATRPATRVTPEAATLDGFTTGTPDSVPPTSTRSVHVQLALSSLFFLDSGHPRQARPRRPRSQVG
ncbi:hypothetical protein ACFPRL_07005 [Pseudoclavibacter helvolus]